MRRFSFLPFLLIGALALAAAFFLTREAGAQLADTDWTDPINLSRSGGTSQPRLVIDAGGAAHLLWRDEFRGFVYSRNETLDVDGLGGWSAPAALELPFGARRFFPDLQPTAATPRFNPHLMADNAGRIHALWIDGEGRLYHSSVNAGDFSDFNAWSGRQLLAEAARAVDMTLGPDGRLHLVYARPIEGGGFPAGVYYRQSNDNGANWSGAVRLYDSPYLRGVSAEQAHVRVTAAGFEGAHYVYAAWDNRQREQLFIARSSDGGVNWEEPLLVDRRRQGDGAEAAGPSRLLVHAHEANVLLTWQAGHDGRNCDQQYQFSNDGGASWSAMQPMSEQLPACPDDVQLLSGEPGLGLLLAQDGQGSLLLAWDGARWSDPQRQTALDNFTDPDTFRTVDFSCYQAVVNARGQLLVAGCDRGRSQDIWLAARPLGGVESWFPPPPDGPVWSAPATLVESDELPAGLTMTGDDEGRFHAFWVVDEDRAISYARWDGSQWSRPSPILRAPDGGPVGRPAVAVADSRLLAVWNDERSGELFFSWANAARATAASEWIAPRFLPVPRPLLTPADIVVDRAGEIYVAYAVPLNEERGVYVTRSEDAGESWSPPFNVFDGVAAGWAAVGPPRLAIDTDGRLYASWTGQTLAGQPQDLYYAFSDDGGLSWSDKTTVVEGEIFWYQTTAVGDRIVHQAWAGQGGTAATATTRPALWHRVSLDRGQSWSRPARIAGLGANPVGPAAMTLDRAGRLHVIQLAPEGEELAGEPAMLQIRQWSWQDERWQSAPAFDLGRALTGDFSAPAAAAAQGDQIAFLFPFWTTADGEMKLAFSGRQVEQPAVTPTPLPALPPPPTATPLPSPTPTPLPTPTLVFPTDAQPQTGLNLPLPDDRWARPIVGIIPAAFLIIIAFFVGLRAMRKN